MTDRIVRILLFLLIVLFIEMIAGGVVISMLMDKLFVP